MRKRYFLLTSCAAVIIVLLLISFFHRQLTIDQKIIRTNASRTYISRTAREPEASRTYVSRTAREPEIPPSGTMGNITMAKDKNSDHYIISFSEGGPKDFYCILSCDNGVLSKTKLYCNESCTYKIEHRTVKYNYVTEEDTYFWEQYNDSILDRIVVDYYDKEDNLMATQYQTVCEADGGGLRMTNKL